MGTEGYNFIEAELRAFFKRLREVSTAATVAASAQFLLIVIDSDREFSDADELKESDEIKVAKVLLKNDSLESRHNR